MACVSRALTLSRKLCKLEADNILRLECAYFSTTQIQHEKKSYKLVIVGGGTGGSAIANKFASKLGKHSVAVIEPSPVSTILSLKFNTLAASNLVTV